MAPPTDWDAKIEALNAPTHSDWGPFTPLKWFLILLGIVGILHLLLPIAIGIAIYFEWCAFWALLRALTK